MAQSAPEHQNQNPYIGMELANENLPDRNIAAASSPSQAAAVSAIDSVVYTALLHHHAYSTTSEESSSSSSSTNPQQPQQPHHIRGMLLGPQGCGKTSLAMDLLYCIAASSTVQAEHNERGSGSSSTTVLMLIMHSSKRRCTPFPAKCCPVRGKHEQPTEQQKHGNKIMIDWNVKALNKVHIKYLSSHADLVSYLTSLQLLPQSERPYGGIVIDDLHLFLQGSSSSISVCDPPQAAVNNGRGTGRDNNHHSMGGVNENMRLVQVLALLSDAGSFLDDDGRRTKANSTPASLLVTIDSTMVSFSHSIMNSVSSYVDSFSIISPSDSSGDDDTNISSQAQEGISNDDASSKKWKISVLQAQDQGSGGMLALRDVVNYSMECDQVLARTGAKLYWETRI
mmetsp:Transcript_29226/g.45414  ORF Transcript_29226/g.45414 Transcript_29226/m.45414 type:complete len:396 (+) Transcript_29226:99-1286(+)